MSPVPPIVDARTETEVREELYARAPGYTPEWKPKTGTPDDALARIFARYSSIFLHGLRQVPERSFLAFLDMLGARLLPAEAARAPLVFTLMAEATLDPLLAANSRVAAVVEPAPPSPLLASEAPAQKPPEIIFETEKEITLARARLTAFFSLDPGSDAFADHLPRLVTGFTLFDEMDPVEHALYAGHDQIFALAGTAEVRLSVELAPVRTGLRPVAVDWEYLSEDGWLPLASDAETGDGTDGFTHDGQIVLRKDCGPDAKEETIAGQKSYWIRGRLRVPLLPEGDVQAGATPLLESILARVSFTKADLLAEAAATDAFALDLSTNFFPFGKQPGRYTTFYLASKETFQRSGARVRINFQLSEKGAPSGVKLRWEYFEGKNWRSIDGFEFQDGTLAFAQSGEVSFRCPPDWAETSVGGTKNFWLRARLDEGNYGEPLKLSVSASPATVTAVPSSLTPPAVASVRLQYAYQTDAELLDHCLSFNDFVFADHTLDCRWPRRTFKPFRPLAERESAVHLGFDQPLPSGLLSLYLHVPGSGGEEDEADETPDFVWEYRAESGWTELGVLDETLSFRRSGMLQFIGPKDAVPVPGLGGDLYRIRARLKQGGRLALAPLGGVWLNAVWATHRAFVKAELLGLSDGNPGQTFHFRNQPVLAGEILEVREWTGRGADYESATLGVPEIDLRLERDPAPGTVKEVWVRWQERPHLFDSGVADRHYLLERATGTLRFGQGPPAGSRIVVAYTAGGGFGNVAAGTIRELRAGVPFLKSVANPVAAQGGALSEALTAVRARGAQQLRHRDRAIAAGDLEWLARDASPAVARAQCLPVTGPIGRVQRGWVSVLVVPHGAEPQPAPTPELRRRIRAHLAARVPAAVAGRVRIVAPVYVAVGVVANVVPTRPDETARVEARLLARLAAFLHPLTGGTDGRGWAFGQPLHLSQIALLLESTEGVDYAVEIAMRVGDELFSDLVPAGPEALIAAGNHELKLTLGER